MRRLVSSYISTIVLYAHVNEKFGYDVIDDDCDIIDDDYNDDD